MLAAIAVGLLDPSNVDSWQNQAGATSTSADHAAPPEQFSVGSSHQFLAIVTPDATNQMFYAKWRAIHDSLYPCLQKTMHAIHSLTCVD